MDKISKQLKTRNLLRVLDKLSPTAIEAIDYLKLGKRLGIPKSYFKDRKYFNETRYVPIDENQSSDHDIETLQAPNVASK